MSEKAVNICRAGNCLYVNTVITFIILFVLPVFALALPAQAEVNADGDRMIIGDIAERYNPGSYVMFLEDKKGNLTVEDIQSEEVSRQFTTADKGLTFGFQESAFWFFLEIENKTHREDWFLEIDFPLLNKIEYYSYHDDVKNEQATGGNFLPFNEREILHRNQVFPVKLYREGLNRIYLHIETDSAMIAPMVLWEPEAFIRKSQNEKYLLGLYYGVLLAMFFYNFSLAVSIKSKSYLFYSFFIAGYLVFQLSFNGLAYEYLWPDHPLWNKQSLSFFIVVTIFWLFLFSRSFLVTKDYSPVIDKIIKILSVYCLFVMPLSVILPYNTSIILTSALPLTSPLLLAAGLICYRKGYQPAGYYLVAMFLFLLSSMLTSMVNTGLLPDIFLRAYGLQISSAISVILFAPALANRINLINKEKEETQKKNVEIQEQLLETQRKWTEELEDEVKERTKDLQEAMNRLEDTQEMLVQSEKMSALGNLVAGIAHEINTPVGVTVTLASYMEEKNREIFNRFSENKLKKSELKEYLEKSVENNEMMTLNLQRASEMIQSFKKVAADQTSEEKRTFAVKDYIEEVLMSLKPVLRKAGHNIILNCPGDLKIKGYPGAFSQVISNLVMNSLLHAYDEQQAGNITLNIEQKNNNLLIEYSDDGNGMSPEVRDKIFDPFFTTDRKQGGTGLGMHIVYNIVTSTLNGTIRCESEEGKGTSFTINLPIQE